MIVLFACKLRLSEDSATASALTNKMENGCFYAAIQSWEKINDPRADGFLDCKAASKKWITTIWVPNNEVGPAILFQKEQIIQALTR